MNNTWQQCLEQLKLQMTRGTFDTWLRGTTAVQHDNTLTIHVHHQHAVAWLTNRLDPIILRTARRVYNNPKLNITYTADPRPAAPPPPSRRPPADPQPPADPLPIYRFNPNTAETGGFTQIGNYAATYWAAYLGVTAWRIYEIIYGAHKRRKTTDWTPPRSWTISALARAVPASRNAIRGRWRRRDGGERIWRPGAFDILTETGIARIHWHDNDPRWRPWRPGGVQRNDATGQRIIYRLAVRITLPLLTPRQVAQLPAALIRNHERYLAAQDDIDILLWEQITIPSIALDKLDQNIISGAGASPTGAPAPVPAPFFPPPPGTSENG